VTFVLVLVTAYELAQLTWQLIPGAPPGTVPAAAQPSVAAPGAGAARGAYDPLLAAHLFGEAPAGAEPDHDSVAAAAAPDTTLAVTLKGILFGEGGAQSTAIIETSQGREDTYQIGATLEGTNAVLRAVYPDHVVLEHDGRLEALRPPRDSVAVAPPASPDAEEEVAEAPESEAVETDEVPSPDAATDAALARAAEVFEMTPEVEGDELKGFVVNPGTDQQTFEALGFKPGDVITAIEDVSLDDAGAAGALLERLATASTLRVVITRDGQSQSLVVDATPLHQEPAQ
jgi:general secretion pathway protein C